MRKIVIAIFLTSIITTPTFGQLITTCETEESDGQTVTRCSMVRILEIEEQPDQRSQRIRRGRVGLYQADSQVFMRLRTMSVVPNFAKVDTATLQIDSKSYSVPLRVSSQMRDTRRPSFERTEATLDKDHLEAVGRADTLRLEAGQAVFLLPVGELGEHANVLLEQEE